MKTLRLLTVALALNTLNPRVTPGQSPGGVGTANLQGWYIAEQGITLTGGAVSGWDDQSPNTHHGSQTIAGSRPLVNTSGLNYNQTVLFDGNNDGIDIPDLVDPAATGLTVFAVARQTSSGSGLFAPILQGQSNFWETEGYTIIAHQFDNSAFLFGVNNNYVTSIEEILEPTIMGGSFNGTTANAVQYFHNGISQGTTNYSGNVGDGGSSTIGSNSSRGAYFHGEIAEVIVFETGFGISDFNKIQSYLAIKYGITLDSDYTNTLNTTVYTTTAPYNQHIIGIAQENSQGLLQKQSHTTDDSTRLYLATLAASNAANTGNFLSDNQYLVTGSDDEHLKEISSEMPTLICSRLQREWKVTNTNFDGSFNLDVKVNAATAAGGIDPNELRLLIDSDGDFSDANIYSSADGLTFSYTNPVITISGISNSMIAQNSTMYVTLAFASGPGGVGTADLQGWYVADQGITLTGGAVSGWENQSPNAGDGSQVIPSRRPLVNTTGFNYHQTIQFDGQDHWIDIPDLVGPATTGITVFAVARQTDTNRDDWGVILFGQSSPGGWNGGGYGLTALAGNKTEFGFWVNSWGQNVGKLDTLPDPTIMSGSWHGTTPSAVEYFHNGISAESANYSGTVGDGGSSAIGSSGNDSYCFYGDIAEVIVYNTGLGNNDFNRVQSYLAVKYGIPLGTDYINSSNAIIYSTSAPYGQHIISIARDDKQGLLQKQSQTIDDSTRLYLATLAAANGANAGSFSSNDQYLVMGSNNGRLEGISSEMPASLFSRLEREWRVTNTSFDGSFSLDITVNSNATSAGIDPNDLCLLVDTDEDLGNAMVYSDAHGLTFSYSNSVITVSGISNSIVPENSTRYFTLASLSASTPLPIELISFNAEALEDIVHLEWTTASEENNDFFTIERSADAEQWEIITTVPGAGHSSMTRHYQAEDHEPIQGTSYYRLKQTDYDGRFEYFDVQSVYVRGTYESDLVIFPNPAAHRLTVTTHHDHFVIEIINLVGQTVLRQENKEEVDLSTLSPGTYLAKILLKDKGFLSKRFIKK